jgi:hypothetical protein
LRYQQTFKKPLLQPQQQLNAVAFGDTHMVGLQALHRELADVSHAELFSWLCRLLSDTIAALLRRGKQQQV